MNKINNKINQTQSPHPSKLPKAIRRVKRTAILASTIIHSALLEQFRSLKEFTLSIIHKIKKKQHFDPFQQIKSSNQIPSSDHEWNLNAALLRDIMDKTDDPEIKKQLRFMIKHYLSKVTPVQAKIFRLINHKFQGLFQIGPQAKHFYHRMAFRQDPKLLKDIADKLPLKKNSPCILLDTPHFEHLLPLKFKVLTLEKMASPRKLAEMLSQIVSDPASLDEDQPILLELSGIFKKQLDEQKSEECEKTLKNFKHNLSKAIEIVLNEKIKTRNPLKRDRITHALYNNITGISKFNLGDAEGVKLLPLASKMQQLDMVKFHDKFLNFIDSTGLFVGHVNAARVLDRDQAPDLHIGKQTKQYGIYFHDAQSFINSSFFKRIEEKCEKSDAPVRILGSAMTHLLKGFLKEIDGPIWDTISKNPIKQELLQTLLYKIAVTLSDAPINVDHYTKFTQAMEIVHADLANLLELTHPFSETDFPPIGKSILGNLPKEIEPLVEARLGKTAVNTFAGVCAAIQESNKTPVKISGDGLYYEEIDFMKGRSLEEVLADPKVDKVDFYACQFNPNIDIDETCHHYQSDNIEANIKKILEKKPQTNQLTVAVDITIDYANSEKMQQLLKSFSKEIESGKINFVFFRSGQKFDIMGMDNFYGSPFYVVNNRDKKWDPFKKFMENPGHRTDSLSLQWYSLMNKYAAKEMDEYRAQIFKNTRDLLDQIPKDLLWNKNKTGKTHISTADADMDACFIDIKLKGRFHRLRSIALLGQFFKRCLDKGIKTQTRASFGFYHPNCILISVNAKSGSSSIRLNPGLNPKDNEAILQFINDIR